MSVGCRRRGQKYMTLRHVRSYVHIQPKVDRQQYYDVIESAPGFTVLLLTTQQKSFDLQFGLGTREVVMYQNTKESKSLLFESLIFLYYLGTFKRLFSSLLLDCFNLQNELWHKIEKLVYLYHDSCRSSLFVEIRVEQPQEDVYF